MSKKYLLLKPPMRSGYHRNNYGNFHNVAANQGTNWYKSRDDMEERRKLQFQRSSCISMPNLQTGLESNRF